jgi:hypothetical protein
VTRWISSGTIRNLLSRHRPPGAVVPFEAPVLRMTRVCDDERDGLIAILRNFADNGATHIVPWNSLPLMVRMTDHDIALHNCIGERKPSSPAEVRAVVSELAISGALGPEAKAAEVARARAGRTQLADVELVLILHLLSSCDTKLAAAMTDQARWRVVDAKAAVATVAAVVGVRRQDIYQRASEFARLLVPVGLVANDGPAQPGWSRVLHAEISAFGDGLAVSQLADSPDVDASLVAIARSASLTARATGIVLCIIDYAVLDICTTIRRWNAERPILGQVIDQLSSMLDEWPALMKAVHDALRAPQDEMARQLRALRAVLPQTPEIDVSADAASQEGAGPMSISCALATRLSAIGSMLDGLPRTRGNGPASAIAGYETDQRQ